jgi:hypothetical protein
LARLPSLSATQKRLLKIIAAGLVALFAFIQTIGAPPEEHERILEEACGQPGLKELAEFAGLFDEGQLCTHGTDPRHAFEDAIPAAQEIQPIVPSRLCKGDGITGPRVHTYLAYPAASPPPDMANAIAEAKRTIGYTEAQLRASSSTHIQGIRWLCRDRQPVIDPLAVPGGLTELDDAINALPTPDPDEWPGEADQIHLFLATVSDFSYCGVGTVMTDTRSRFEGNDGAEDELNGRAYSLVSHDCQAASSTTLHELGHNIGAVQPGAPHAGGNGWHGYQENDVMSYSDGSEWWTCTNPYNTSGCGQPKVDCPAAEPWTMDCGKDDYWSPRRPTTGFWETHWNTAHSPFLSQPRRR